MKSLGFWKPVFIIGAPRSGTTMLFNILSHSNKLYNLSGEGQNVWEKFYHPSKRDWHSNVLSKTDVNMISEYYIKLRFFLTSTKYKSDKTRSLFKIAINALFDFRKYFDGTIGDFRFLEKTPKNCLRVSFIHSLFKDALFIYLKRDGRDNINSLIEGWKCPSRYKTYDLKKYINIIDYGNVNWWCFALPPGWQALENKRLVDICAFQWVNCNEKTMDALSLLNKEQVYTLSYEQLIKEPYVEINKIIKFINIEFDEELQKIASNPPVVNFVTKPEAQKWRRQNREQILSIYPIINDTMEKMGYALD